MTDRNRAKQNSTDESVLVDNSSDLRATEIPRLEYAEAEPYCPGGSFQQIQTQAWWMYLRAMAPKNAGGEDEIHTSLDRTIRWINQGLQDTDEEAREISRTTAKEFVPAKTLQCVESVVPGSAEIYYWGPDFSLLWSALSGKEDEGRAMTWFLDQTGLSFSEVSKCSTGFLNVLLDVHELIALHAVAAMLSILPKQLAHIGFKFPEDLRLLHPGPNFRLKTMERRSDDRTLSLLLDNVWFQRAMACINHNATIGRLSAYGLARDDILFVTGKPTLSPKKVFKHAFGQRHLIGPITFDRDAIPASDIDAWTSDRQCCEDGRLSLATVTRYWYGKIGDDE